MSEEETQPLRKKLEELADYKRRVEARLEVRKLQYLTIQSEIKRLELDILLTPPSGSANTYRRSSIRQAETLRSYKLTLQANEARIANLQHELRDVSIRYFMCAYWLNQALYGDNSKQHEALRHILEE